MQDYKIGPTRSFWPTVFDGYELEIHLVDHCDLQCNNCNHFSPLASPFFITKKDFKNQLNLIKERLPSIKVLMLLGGEPFLHPNLIELCQIARDLFPDIELKILTNGIILNNYDEKKIKKLENLNININISKYPNQKYKKFNNKNISYLNDRFFFCQTLVNPLGTEDVDERIYDCPNKIPCFTLKNYKIYFCQFGAHINNFCHYFFKQIPLIKNKDFIELTKNTTLQDLQNLKICQKNICKYCKPGDIVNWNHSTKTYDEYTKTEKELFLTNYNEYYQKFVNYSNFKKFAEEKFWNNVDSWYCPYSMRTFRKRQEGKIDIIIPIYRLDEQYFIKCINSIFSQSIIDDCIIYLISDCSPDKELIYDIYKKYKIKYNLILLDTQVPQSGPGIARTLGITNSYNKYFFCLDSDDYLYNNKALEILYNYAEKHNSNFVNGQTYDSEHGFVHDGHGYLYNRKIFYDNNFSYGKFIYNEDKYLSLQISKYYQSYNDLLLEEPVYYYNRNNNSMGKEIDYLYMIINELIMILYFYKNFLQNVDYESNKSIITYIFDTIIYNLSIIEKITNENKKLLSITKDDAICISLICVILINNQQLFNQLSNTYKNYINKLFKKEFIKLETILIFDLDSLFNRGNYIIFNNNLLNKFINNEYKNFIKQEEKKYGNQFKFESQLE